MEAPIVYDGCFSTKGFFIKESSLEKAFAQVYPTFLQGLTFTHTPRVGGKIVRTVYEKFDHEGQTYLFLPRSVYEMFVSKKMFNIAMLVKIPPTLPFVMHIELFPEQKIIFEHLMTNVFSTKKLHDGTAACLLDLEPGKGKSYIAGAIIATLKLPTLYITTSKELADQAVKDLRICLYDKGGSSKIVVKRYDKKDLTLTYGVCVMIINTAIKIDRSRLDGLGLIVLDEAHRLCAEEFCKIYRRVVTCASLSMSGSVQDRKDPFDAIVHREAACGGIIHGSKLLPPVEEDMDPLFDLSVKIINYKGPPEYSKVLTRDKHMSSEKMIKQFVQDPYRTKVTMSEIRKLYDWRGDQGQQHCIYVFCEYRDPLFDLAKSLSIFLDDGVAVVDDHSVETFVGGISKEQSVIVRNYARVILATFAFAGTGVSLLKATAIVLFSSRRAQFRQITARILRLCSDYTIPRHIIDIVNINTPMKNQLADRLPEYERYKAKISYEDISWRGIDLAITK